MRPICWFTFLGFNDSFTEDLGPGNRKRVIKYTQVLGTGFYRLGGQFKLTTVNFPEWEVILPGL